MLGFLKALKVNTKDKGIISLGDSLLKPQKIVLNTIFECLKSDQRYLYILKSRQMGCSTICLAFDLYYVMKNRGLSYAIMTHEYAAKLRFRSELRKYYESLPGGFKIPKLFDNQDMMGFLNGSEFHFFHSSTRLSREGKAARSYAHNAAHITEVAFLNNYEDLNSLEDSFSSHHPKRIYIYESTANGFNEFFYRWEAAKKGAGSKTLFLGWYLNELYRYPKTSLIYRQYSHPLSPEEKEFAKKIEAFYGYKVDMEQWAWYRYVLEERKRGDMVSMLQEFPHTEEEAFQFSGMKYFDSVKVSQEILKLRDNPPECETYYVRAQGNEITAFKSDYKYNLCIWEFPKPEEVYVMGCDPTFGASPDSDNAVISIWKCYKNKLIQVAELVDNMIDPVEFAKMIIFLGSLYNSAYVTLEITGCGIVTLREMDSQRASNFSLGFSLPEELRPKALAIREYFYRRPDTMGRSFLRHFKTTSATKEHIFSLFQACFNGDLLDIKSEELLEEMGRVIKDGTMISAPSGFHDDRVIAAALAIEGWHSSLRMSLRNMPEQGEEKPEIVMYKERIRRILECARQ